MQTFAHEAVITAIEVIFQRDECDNFIWFRNIETACIYMNNSDTPGPFLFVCIYTQ